MKPHKNVAGDGGRGEAGGEGGKEVVLSHPGGLATDYFILWK